MSVSKPSILVLGSASWLGSLMISKLNLKKFDITATYFNTSLNFSKPVQLFKAKSLKDYQDILKVGQFDFIINFLRGENESGYKIHEAVIDYAENNPTQYLYCSSALALDAYKNEALTEDKLAMAESEYGMFKANCEKMLYDSGIEWSILRFSSLQGYCAHKTVRNEHFLKQLQQGKTVGVDQKVIQNRMFADDAVNLMIKIIEQQKTGIIHLGTTDASDEIDFLRAQAEIFGLDTELVKANKTIRNVNLNCIPAKIFEIAEETKNFTETDTLKKIFQIEAFKKFRTADVI